MPFPAPPRAVLLDMDGTLLDTESIFVGSMFAALGDMGFQLDDKLTHALIGRPGKECMALLQDAFGARFNHAEFHPVYVAHRTERMRDGIPLKPGVPELLDRLDQAGLPALVATSSTQRTAQENLTRTGLLNRFAAVVTRDEAEAPKPHPSIFLKAAETAGVPPGACLAVEDSHVGVRAAHAAGAMTVMVPDMLQPSDEIRAMCLHVVDDLHAVRGLVDRALRGR